MTARTLLAGKEGKRQPAAGDGAARFARLPSSSPCMALADFANRRRMNRTPFRQQVLRAPFYECRKNRLGS
jgi:hypothetical protein